MKKSLVLVSEMTRKRFIVNVQLIKRVDTSTTSLVIVSVAPGPNLFCSFLLQKILEKKLTVGEYSWFLNFYNFSREWSLQSVKGKFSKKNYFFKKNNFFFFLFVFPTHSLLYMFRTLLVVEARTGTRLVPFSPQTSKKGYIFSEIRGKTVIWKVLCQNSLANHFSRPISPESLYNPKPL